MHLIIAAADGGAHLLSLKWAPAGHRGEIGVRILVARKGVIRSACMLVGLSTRFGFVDRRSCQMASVVLARIVPNCADHGSLMTKGLGFEQS